MKITVTVNNLLSALRVLATAWSRSNLAGAPACAWIAQADTLTLRAASLEWDAQYTMPATTNEPGTAWIPAALMRALPWGQLGPAFEVHATQTILRVRSGALSYDLPLLNRERVGAIIPGTIPCTRADGPALSRALLLGSIAARPLATGSTAEPAEAASRGLDREGLWIELSPGRLEASSTDRVQVTHAAIPVTTDSSMRFAIPTHAALAIARSAALAPSAELHCSPGQPTRTLTLVAGAAAITMRTLAQFPPDPRLAPWREAGPTLRCGANVLTEALRATCTIGGTDPRVLVTLRSHKSRLYLTVAAQSAAAAATVDLARGEWHDTAVTVPARALLATLAPLRETEVKLHLGDGDSPVQITAQTDPVEYRAIIAPIAPEPARTPTAAQAAGSTK